MRIALGLEYRGTKYFGWQKQEGLKTIQSSVETALTKIADQPIEVFASGRTDAGVHALGQVIHFDSSVKRDLHAWVFGGNSILDNDIRLQWAKEVPSDFHARFSALARHYRYFIYNHPIPTAIGHERSAFYYLPLDENLMQEAGQYLIGEHDFSAFRGADCQARTPNRNVSAINIKRSGRIITVDVIANAFLQHMVRNIIGVLFEIGSKKQPPIWAKEVLEGKDRNLGGITAPATGLYLLAVHYPEKYLLPQINTDHLANF